jgi:hypothetical protein
MEASAYKRGLKHACNRKLIRQLLRCEQERLESQLPLRPVYHRRSGEFGIDKRGADSDGCSWRNRLLSVFVTLIESSRLPGQLPD